MKKNISAIVFWGATWGIAEATLGYLLHMLPVNIGWVLWFPLAFMFMRGVYKQTGRLSSIIYTSIIAASIKLVNLLMPARIDMVINPAVSIILEGAAVYAGFRLFESKFETLKKFFVYLWTLAASISWRVLYIIYVLFLPSYLVKISPIGGIVPFLKFMFLESAANSVLIYLYVRLTEKKSISEKVQSFNTNPILSFSLLLCAILIQFVI